MIKKLENDFLTVEINQTGAELFSIKSKKTGIEYVWQGDAKYWKGKAPLLFPICGRLFGGKYTYKGAEYQMQLHGFARNVDFSSKVISNEVIEFELNSSEESKKQYPFDFNLVVRYTLKDTALKTEFIVKNTGKEDLYFSCGGHPGFNVPFTDGEKFEDYYIEFGKNELSRLIFSETCFCTGKAEKYPLTDNKLALKHDLFDNDALFFETNTETEKVTLKNKNNNNAVEMSYGDMTCLGIWHMPKTDAPYVCIEPWHGVPSTDGIVDDFESKQQLIKLAENKVYDNFFTIKIVED